MFNLSNNIATELNIPIIIYATDDPDLMIAYFKDDATAFNNKKKGVIADKGIINNAISSKLFQILTEQKIPNHFIKHLNEREMLIKKLKMLPLEVIVRNIVAGSLAKRMGMSAFPWWLEAKIIPLPCGMFSSPEHSTLQPLQNIINFDQMVAAFWKTLGLSFANRAAIKVKKIPVKKLINAIR